MMYKRSSTPDYLAYRLTSSFLSLLTKASLDIGIYSVSPEFVAEGERKTLEAIELYKQFFILGEDLDSYTIVGTL
jgi:hypothetical protein